MSSENGYKTQHQPINTWSPTERPRERLLAQGAESLSDSELLAVLLRTGRRGHDAIAVSRGLLKKYGGWRGVLALGRHDLEQVKGLGPAKIATLLAASEITRRKLRSEAIGSYPIRDPQAVVDYLACSIRDLKKEVFKALFLNKANCVLDEATLFEGTADQSAVHPREIVKATLDRHATGIILAHNHPSGRIEPSSEDKEITQKIQSACATVSVKVLDHIIIGNGAYFSFKEAGLLI